MGCTPSKRALAEIFLPVCLLFFSAGAGFPGPADAADPAGRPTIGDEATAESKVSDTRAPKRSGPQEAEGNGPESVGEPDVRGPEASSAEEANNDESGAEEEKTEVESKPDRALPKESQKDIEEWIMKRKRGRKTQLQETKPVAWRDPAQKTRCESYLPRVKESFQKAKYYSTQGDFCRTEQFAESFLSLTETCTKDCPEGFLEQSGFTDAIIRNVGILQQLGEQRCKEILRLKEEP